MQYKIEVHAVLIDRSTLSGLLDKIASAMQLTVAQISAIFAFIVCYILMCYILMMLYFAVFASARI